MTTRTDDKYSRPIESRADLLSVFEDGEKPRDEWRIGTEHEKFVFRRSDHGAPSYDEPGGIRDLLTGLTQFGWKPVVENGNVIAAHAVSGHPLLQSAAVGAARQARFSPTKLSGQPVKVTGVIQYNFVAQ